MINKEYLKGKKVAILSETGFEQSELTSPKAALEEAGLIAEVISPEPYAIRGWQDGNWGIEIKVDHGLEEANAEDFIALVLPGGVMNPDRLRTHEKAIEFIKKFSETGKPIAAICHGPQTLIETGLLEGKEMTSFPSIKTDLINAGAKWTDREVVVDEFLITSRSPKDLPAFNDKLLEQLSEGRQKDIN